MREKKKTSPVTQTKKGFTLLELLLYISISAVILFFSLAFLALIQEAKIKNQTIAEVEQQGVQAIEIMTQIIRNAKEINTPPAGSLPGSSFSVDTPVVLNNPTIFDIADGKIRMKQGNNSAMDITSSRVIASELIADNVSRTGTGGIIRFRFTLTYMNNSGRHEYNYSKTFYNSISLR